LQNAITLAPILAFAALIFANPLLGWYWPRAYFEGKTLVVERGPLAKINTVYCQAMLALGSAIYLVGIVRHQGNERLRLIVLALAYGFMFVGFWLWIAGVPLYRGINPLSLFLTLGFYTVGISLFFYGFPRMKAPVTEADLLTKPPIELPPIAAQEGSGKGPATGATRYANEGQSFPAPHELTERQEEILRVVMEGRPYRAIAAELGITERTVKYHMGQILEKCELETREQLIAWAALRGRPPAAGYAEAGS
jgi:Response regulator containing a CheY-like receiver domain and an HTH DNA-binding domain